MTEDTDISKGRKLMIVVEDDGGQNFNVRLEGDVDRLSMAQIPPSLYSAAEHWGLEFFKLCNERLKAGDGIRQLNRNERRLRDAKR